MKQENLLKEIRNKFCYVDSCPFSGKRIFFENAGGSLTLSAGLTGSTTTVGSSKVTSITAGTGTVTFA